MEFHDKYFTKDEIEEAVLMLGYETKDAIVITNTTAPPMPAAVSVFLETPRKEQIPRN